MPAIWIWIQIDIIQWYAAVLNLFLTADIDILKP